MTTRVVDLHNLTPQQVEAIADLVYVGRAQRFSKKKCARVTSDWASPFKPKDYPREKNPAAACVEAYRQDLLKKPALLARLPELRGKVLACWCCDWPGHGEPPAPCHAVLLARMADGAGIASGQEKG
jgi:hypothetical protein